MRGSFLITLDLTLDDAMCGHNGTLQSANHGIRHEDNDAVGSAGAECAGGVSTGMYVVSESGMEKVQTSAAGRRRDAVGGDVH